MNEIENQLYGKKVIDNRNLKMIDSIKYLLNRADITNLDISVGYFYLSGLLLLKHDFIRFMDNKNGHLRILMGNQTSGQTVNVISNTNFNDFAEYAKDFTIKDTDEISDHVFLEMISKWVEEKRIEIKVYTGKSNYFHAKSYLFSNDIDSKNGTAIVGSSNFSKNGLEGNTELNVLGQDVYFALHQWYCDLWSSNEVDEFSPELINIVGERISVSLQQLKYKTVEETYYDFASIYSKPYVSLENEEWIDNLYPHQKSGVISVMDKLDSFNTAVLADGVGLGKTRTVAGIIKLYLQENDTSNIIIIADKKLETQWNEELAILGINKNMYNYFSRDTFTNLSVKKIESINCDLMIIDEAHQGFKNNNTKAYRKIKILKQSNPEIRGLLMTATPWNNRREDVVNLGMLFINIDMIPSNREYKQYMLIGGNSNKVVKQIANDDKAFSQFWTDIFLQRTRKTYGGKNVKFPHREFPTVNIQYEPQKNDIFYDNFDSISGLTFPYMDPIKYINDSKEALGANQLKILLLKRADSSWISYRESLINIINKLNKLKSSLGLIQRSLQFEKKDFLRSYKLFLYGSYSLDEYDMKNIIIPGLEYDDKVDTLNQLSIERKKQYLEKMKDIIDSINFSQAKVAVSNMLADSEGDLSVLSHLINSLNHSYSFHDEKLETILDKVKYEVKKQHKVILISQFKTTANYYYEELYKMLKDNINVGLVVGGQKSENKINNVITSKKQVLNHFSPNSKNMIDFINKKSEVDLLVGTDTISTGQNLQDAVTLMNIDLPYNPMILEQRIGRIDRPRKNDANSNQNIFIYTFPAYSSIEGQLKMTERLGNKMKGILDDTQFDNVVLPEYQQYLKDMTSNKHDAVKNMVDSTIDKYIVNRGLSSDEHSEQYRVANKRMYDFKINGIKRVKKPLIGNVSFSKGNSNSIAVIKVNYNDVNGGYLNNEDYIINFDNMKLMELSNAEDNIFNEINYDCSYEEFLTENKANYEYKKRFDLVSNLKTELINRYNMQISEFYSNTDNLVDKISDKAVLNIMESAKADQENVISIMKDNDIDPKDLSLITKYIKTIGPDDDLYPVVKDIAANVKLFWFNFSKYKEFFTGDNLDVAKKIGIDLKSANNVKADLKNTVVSIVLANVVIEDK